MATIKGVLIITPFFSPNIGGVESHLDDLVNELNKNKINSYVLTYSPLTTKTTYLTHEKRGLCHIIRFPWFGYQLFPKLEKYPLLDFLYLTPYLLIRSFFWLIFNKSQISIIHSQGFNAAFIGVILGKIFNLKHICSTHAVYENIQGLSKILTVKILSLCDQVLCLSQASINQLTNWGLKSSQIKLYRYWINQSNFKPSTSPSKFTILFVGRLIAKKGIRVVLKAAVKLPIYQFLIAGNGPLEKEVANFSRTHKNTQYLGAIPNKNLPKIYQQASLFCIASQYPEGYGRVIMEAVASGIPVIGSNFGAIPEALDNTVSILFSPTTTNFVKYINILYQNPKQYQSLQKNCRSYAKKYFSSRNFQTILKTYHQLLNKS